jgi:hypothetical protein
MSKLEGGNRVSNTSKVVIRKLTFIFHFSGFCGMVALWTLSRLGVDVKIYLIFIPWMVTGSISIPLAYRAGLHDAARKRAKVRR